MAKGVAGGRATGTTVSGTRNGDTFTLSGGELWFNGTEENYTAPLSLKGNAGNDRFILDDPHGAVIDGGKGYDTLDFSSSAGPVAVMDWANGRGVYTNFTLVHYADQGFSEHHPEAFPTGGTKTAAPIGIEEYIGTAWDDYLSVGVSGPTRIFGGDGNDRIYGYVYDDHLEGGNGNDLLFGKAGSDTLLGGAGADRFYFVTMEGNGHDVVADFNPAEGDHIFIGEQTESAAGTLQWRNHDYDGDGLLDSVRADFAGVSITLLGWNTEDANFGQLATSYTTFVF